MTDPTASAVGAPRPDGKTAALVHRTSAAMRRRYGRSADVAQDWAADRTDAIRDTMLTKPFMAIAMSAVVAFILGKVLGGRRARG